MSVGATSRSTRSEIDIYTYSKKIMDIPQHIKISQIVDETNQVKTFYFDYALGSKPGQFVMLWIPGVDQKPFSIAYDDGQKFGLTVFNRGPLTNKLFQMKVNDCVGIIGPYGTNFSLRPNTRYIMVAGGYGAAPLGFLAEEIAKLNNQIDFLAGARSASDLLFEKRISAINNAKLHIATNDGSQGHCGFVTDLLAEMLARAKDKEKILVATCGPELMEKKVLDICNQYDVNCEVSIERYMKCGIGVCGQCAVDPLGICMCTHGPVVSRELANQITEFGKYHRDKSGKIVYF
ncbi:MAG: dihydroorotate dehydrogenase electron transfer subunit [Candidatus Magasanikbacteria bacterium CG10_big_fil_rev_8_21_14_0_10_40_10]|uniref:Dihydroorotate dehydrogenase electron transfer subunit n=1 Tax=Candidatus Magasanikbacteria bacterium CG10_big_fil_rev_8_21_14_0_10_40_10 TaxID=1974648 RepID=A0A2M6W3U2_9BACT|nr:MAG: dihydroorotate dehydrogenase electron transfer subunit [Candidatus Magasanikbacteria bacterium CG10_big_fil_rev_8_21_14_0_10_40_10]